MGAWQQARSTFEFVEAFSFEEILELEGLVGVCAGAGLPRRTLCAPAGSRLGVELKAALPHLRGKIRILLHLNKKDFLAGGLTYFRDFHGVQEGKNQQ